MPKRPTRRELWDELDKERAVVIANLMRLVDEHVPFDAQAVFKADIVKYGEIRQRMGQLAR